MSLNKLINIKRAVFNELMDNEESRKDDNVLIVGVLKQMGYNTTQGLIELANEGIPPFESITRARRKIQKEFPELKHKNTAVKREKAREDYKEFSRVEGM